MKTPSKEQVINKLIKMGNNIVESKKMVEKNYEYATRCYEGLKYIATACTYESKY